MQYILQSIVICIFLIGMIVCSTKMADFTLFLFHKLNPPQNKKGYWILSVDDKYMGTYDNLESLKEGVKNLGLVDFAIITLTYVNQEDNKGD